MSWTRTSAFALAATLLVSLPFEAQAQVCDESNTQSALQYLRRLSLDLRGHLPSVDELNSVVTNDEIDPAIIRSMLQSEDAVTQLRAYHRDLLWTNVVDQRLSNQSWQLRLGDRAYGGGRDVYWLNGRGRRYRGVQNMPCLDEPARFDPTTNAILTTTDQATGATREGWVEVSPYWAPNTTVKVCAFDAQTATEVPQGNRMVSCESNANNTACGCGPNLQYCQNGAATGRVITAAFNEQLLRYADDIVRSDRPYTDLIVGKDMEVNGPISHYFRYQSFNGQNQLLSSEQQGYTMPELEFNDSTTWQKVDRGQRHSGVLTMPAYFIKFQTDRGRANRFYNAFLCQHFEAPAGGLPAAADSCHEEPDLTKRCGCAYCHASLEPAAAYWGRWSEAGLIPLAEAAYPERDMECTGPNAQRIGRCRRFYLTRAGHPDEEPYVGMLLPYVFADDARKEAITAGPESIARQAIDNGAFARCTATKMWSRYMHRAPADDEADVIAELASGFSADNYNLRNLIERIVKRPEYAAAGRFSADKE